MGSPDVGSTHELLFRSQWVESLEIFVHICLIFKTQFLTAAGKYRLHSISSLVTVSVRASAMCKLQKEMYPSLRQLQGWDNPLLSITTGKPGTIWHFLLLVTGEVLGISFTLAGSEKS